MNDLDLRIEGFLPCGWHQIRCLVCGHSWGERLHPPGHEDKVHCPRCFTEASLSKMVTTYRTLLLEENAKAVAS